MLRSETRILTTHTGSLPRPREIVELFVRREKGEAVDTAELARVGDAAVRRAIARQAEAGIDVANDGEQKREGFFRYLRQRLSGLGGTWERPARSDHERYPIFKEMRRLQDAARHAIQINDPYPKAIGEIRYLDPQIIEDDCKGFRAALAAEAAPFAETFLTAPSPGILATTTKNEHYDTQDTFLTALTDALKVEYEAIVRNGFILQIDGPDLALEGHLTYGNRPLSDFLDFVERVIAQINRALVNIPRDRVRLHVCWGNSESPHDSDVPLEHILPIVRKADVGGFVLPFANPRHAHEYRLFEKMPLADDQILVAGVIDTLTNFVEHPQVVAERLERVAEAVGDPRRVLAGTDCGFDTAAGFGRVAEDVVWAKLRSMSEGAKIASERLFRT